MTIRTGTIAAVIAAIAAVSALPAKAWEHPPYDRKIEEAVIRILQPKLGEIRGSLGLSPRGHIYPPVSQRADDGGRSAWMKLVKETEMAQISWN